MRSSWYKSFDDKQILSCLCQQVEASQKGAWILMLSYNLYASGGNMEIAMKIISKTHKGFQGRHFNPRFLIGWKKAILIIC